MQKGGKKLTELSNLFLLLDDDNQCPYQNLSTVHVNKQGYHNISTCLLEQYYLPLDLQFNLLLQWQHLTLVQWSETSFNPKGKY